MQSGGEEELLGAPCCSISLLQCAPAIPGLLFLNFDESTRTSLRKLGLVQPNWDIYGYPKFRPCAAFKQISGQCWERYFITQHLDLSWSKACITPSSVGHSYSSFAS